MNTTQSIIVISTVAGSIGALGGYYLAKMELTKEYDEISRQEIEEAKRFYSTLNKKEEFETPEKAVEALIETPENEGSVAIRRYQGQTVSVVTSTTGLVETKDGDSDESSQEEDSRVSDPEGQDFEASEETETSSASNIFVDGKAFDPDEWDLEAERVNRELGRPYVITENDWEDDKNGYEHSELTYFEYDETLVDDDEAMIDDIDQVVGFDNLKRFGHGSGDPMVVYIRNDRQEIDFQVMRHTGSYAEEVLGLVESESDDHSDAKLKKFRTRDE